MAEIQTKQFSGSLIEQLASDLLKPEPAGQPAGKPAGWVRDAQWVRQSFITGVDQVGAPLLDRIDVLNQSFSSADIKFTDTSLGGNTVINPPPSFTRYADPPGPGFLANQRQRVSLGLATGYLGQGTYYSEAIDDRSQVVHFRFGRPQYNSFTQFFTGWYSVPAGRAARSGRFDQNFFSDLFYTAGSVLGIALIPLAIIPMAVLALGNAARYFLNMPASKFYTLKPTMPLYWNAVTTMVNQMAANLGVVSYVSQQDQVRVFGKVEVNDVASNRALLSSLSNGIISQTGSIDVFQIAARAKRMEMQYENAISEAITKVENQDDKESFFSAISAALRGYHYVENHDTVSDGSVNQTRIKAGSLEALLAKWINAKPLSDPNAQQDMENDGRVDNSGNQDSKSTTWQQFKDKASTYINEVGQYFVNTLGDGSDWVSYRVDYTGPMSSSFSSNTAPSSIGQKINSFSSQKQNLTVNYSGAVSSVPGLATVLGMASDVVQGAAASLHLDGLAAFAGTSFADIPENWESSVAQLPKANYTITLGGPYTNPISLLFDVYIPLATLMAGALPISTGKQSYTMPFLCQIHDKGRLMSRLAIIDSLTITYGEGNVGFNKDGRATSVTVTVGVKDLTSILTIPIHQGLTDMPFAGLFDAENAFSDYLMAITGLKLSDCIYPMPVLRRQMRAKRAEIEAFTSAASLGNAIGSWPGVNMLSSIMRGTSR